MASITNLPDRLAVIREEHQFREILLALDRHGCGNGHILYHWLGELGLGPSWRDLEALLDRLDAAGLTTSSRVETTRVVHITRDGREIVEGRVLLDWIARPDPPAG